jgi:hypothetical protein
MSIKECLIEVQSAVKDVFNDEEAKDILNKIQNKINEKRNLKDLSLTEDRIAQEVLDQEKKIKLIKKFNALNNKKMLYEAFTRGIENFPGKPEEFVKAMLGGVASSQKFAQLSVDNYQVLYKNKYTSGFEQEIRDAGLEDLITRPEVQEAIFIEKFDNPFLRLSDEEKAIMVKNKQQLPPDRSITQNEYAYQIAKIGKKYNDMTLEDKNSLGAFIKREPGYVLRNDHDAEKMIKGAGDDVLDEATHKATWVEYIKTRLDLNRSFEGANDKQINDILSKSWDNILSGFHITTLGGSANISSKNIANKVSAERVFHFKDGKSFYEYNQKYGHGDYITALEQGFLKSSRDAGLMKVLGTNPEQFLSDLVTLFRNHYGGTIARDLNVERFRKLIKELDGSINAGYMNPQAKIGSVIGAMQETGKLGGITPTSLFGDLPNIMVQVKHDDMNMFDSMSIVFKELARTTDKKELQQVMKPFGLFINNFVSGLNQHATINEDLTGAIAKYKSGFYKWTGFKSLMERMKSGVFLAYQNHFGILAKNNNWNQLSDQTKRILGLYGIDDGMWNMMRKTSLREFEGYELLTIDNIAEIPKNDIIDYLKIKQPALKKINDKKINEIKNDIQSKWRMFLYSRVHHGVLEPGARERAILHQGLERGTTAGLLNRLIVKFKSFPVTVYTKKLETIVKGSGEDIKYSNYIPALAYYTVLGTMFGYASLSVADMLMGKEPRDPTDPKTALASLAKGGGGSIFVDIFYQEISRSNGGAASTILGPAFADAEGLFKVLKNTFEGKFDKAGLKAYRLFEANTPIDIWYLRPAYNYLIGYHVKDMLDPGYFDRLEGYTKKATGQEFFLKP